MRIFSVETVSSKYSNEKETTHSQSIRLKLLKNSVQLLFINWPRG